MTNQPIQENEAAKVHSFKGFLSHVADGELERQLNKELTNIVEAMRTYYAATGNPCKASMTIKVDFTHRNDIIEVSGDVKTNTPKEKLSTSIFFPTKDCQLSLENPRQQKLPFMDVVKGNADVVNLEQKGA